MSTRLRNLARRRRRREGMTLTEIMIVVIIMALIAAAVGVAVIPKWRQAQATQARTDAQTIRGAAERFLLTNTNADCPTVENLIEAAEISRQARTKDPWDHDFRIECQGTEIIVTSGGPDGSFGGEDDIH